MYTAKKGAARLVAKFIAATKNMYRFMLEDLASLKNVAILKFSRFAAKGGSYIFLRKCHETNLANMAPAKSKENPRNTLEEKRLSTAPAIRAKTRATSPRI